MAERRLAEREKLVVVRAVSELHALALLGRRAQAIHLREAVVVRRQLRAREARALPLADGLALFLETLVHHQGERGLLVHRPRVDLVVEDRVAREPEEHLLPLEA